MDAHRFDELLRVLSRRPSRRGIARTLAAITLAGMFGTPGLAEVQAKRKRKKKKCKGGKKKCGKRCCAVGDACLGGSCCPAAQACGAVCCTVGDACIANACCPVDGACGAACCASGEACLGGSCCPAERACGTVCCPAGQRCGAPGSGTCVAGQGTCAAGASSCGSDNFIFCNGQATCVCVRATDGTTRCATPIEGITESDCGLCTTDADCALQFPAIVGAICASNATAPCSCPAGKNLCTAPCPVV